MKLNKAQLSPQFAIIGVVVVIIIAMISIGVSGGGYSNIGNKVVETFNPVVDGCKPKPLTAKFTGYLEVHGKMKFLRITPDPTPKQISRINYQFQQLSFLGQDYTWQVCPINPRTGAVIGKCDSGRDEFKVFASLYHEQPFTIYTHVMDQNCNGIIDEDFDIRFRASINDGKETKTIETEIFSFREGYLQN